MRACITGGALVTGGFIYVDHLLLNDVKMPDRNTERNRSGQFKRTRKIFSLDNFNDGYADADGRFRVYCPNHHRAYESGYVLRSIAAYELYHNIRVPSNMAIHHVDGNRLNDNCDNLVMMLFGQHSSFHNEPRKRQSQVERICKHCSQPFMINRWRLKDPRRGQYCSNKCFHKHGRSLAHRQHISDAFKRRRLTNAKGS